MKQKKTILLGVLVAAALVVAGGRRLQKRHAISQSEETVSSDAGPGLAEDILPAARAGEVPQAVAAPRPAAQAPVAAFTHLGSLLDAMEETAYRLQNGGARGVLLARIEDLHVEEPGSVAAYLALLDLWEEVQTLRRSSSAEDAGHLAAVTAQMEAFLRHEDCEMLCGTEWDPAHQRALRVEYVLPAGSAPQVAAPVSAGLKVRGRLVRRQSVMLRKGMEC